MNQLMKSLSRSEVVRNKDERMRPLSELGASDKCAIYRVPTTDTFKRFRPANLPKALESVRNSYSKKQFY